MHTALRLLIALTLSGLPCLARQSENHLVLSVSLTTPGGEPVAGAQGVLVNETYNPLIRGWIESDQRGTIEIREDALRRGRSFPTGAAFVLVRAGGHGWLVHQVNLGESRSVALTMQPGRAVSMTLSREDGAPLPPTLEPIVFAGGWSVAAWVSVQYRESDLVEDLFSASEITRRGDQFIFNVPAGLDAPIWVLIDHPGYLRTCQIGPIEPSEFADGHIDIVLPAPGAIDVTLAPKHGASHAYDACGARLTVHPEIPDGRWMFPFTGRFGTGRSFNTSFEHLAPGRYVIDSYTGDEDNYHDQTRADFYRESMEIDVAGGARADATIALQTFDLERAKAELSGVESGKIGIARTDGSIPAGIDYRIVWPSYNFARRVAMAEGVVPESGTIEFDGLARRSFVFELGGEPLASLDLTDSDGERKEFTFTLAPRAGEAAPNVTLTRLDTGETVTLDAFRGQVVLLEFWASWCGPCQQPMSEYDRLMREHAEEWEGKAVIIGASIDERIETIRNHVEKRGWTNVVQVHCGQGTWESEAATSFGVRSVPSACLIDPTGQIIWIGHPSSIDVEERIRAYLEANAAGSG